MAGGARRIVTRSVSASGAAALNSLTVHQPPLDDMPEEQQTNEHKFEPSHDTPSNEPERPTIRKRPSSIGLEKADDTKRLKPEDTAGKEERSDEAGGLISVSSNDLPPVTQLREQDEELELAAGPSKLPSPPPLTLKRSRGEEVSVDDEPRKRQAFDPSPPSPPKTPFFDLTKMKLSLPKSRSLPQLPSMFTPADQRGATTSNKGKQRASLENDYCDYLVPLKDADEETVEATSVKTPLKSPELKPTAQFTFNPFAITTSEAPVPEKPPERPSHTDAKFGPIVPSLQQMLAGGAMPPPPASASAAPKTDGDASLPPSPTKGVLSFKPRPSMIPRLVLAPPPPANPSGQPKVKPSTKPFSKPTPKNASPMKSSLSRFFASPVKGQNSQKSNGKTTQPRPRPSDLKNVTGQDDGDADAKRNTGLSVEAQASLANLSEALHKLSEPRPRTSLGDRSTASDDLTLIGSSSSSPEDDIAMKLADLPPRPSTSLGINTPSVPHTRTRPNRLVKQKPLIFPSAKAGPNRKSTEMPLPPTAKPSKPSTTSEGSGGKPAVDKGKHRSSSPDEGTSLEVEVISECLKGCTIFVDVRTEEGSDASAMFVQMLKQLSAKIITRPGITATHIVWKTGQQSTLTKYNSMALPKPFLVGISWVVECSEKQQRADETKYLVNVKEAENIFGAKRRRSLQVKDRSSLTHGLLPSNSKPRVTSNPLTTQSTLRPGGQAKITSRFPVKSMKGKAKAPIGGLRLQAPPTPVREEDEPMEDVEDYVEVEALPDPAPVPPRPETPVPQFELRPAGIIEPPARPPPNLKPKPPPPPPLQLKSSDTLLALDALLTDTKATLIAEAQTTQDQLERARKRSMLFAPKVSSPLKKNFSVFRDDADDNN